MLIDFTVGNFLSFKDKKTLSLEATKITDHPDSTFESGHHRLLKSSVIYGANSSGKSNLIKAMSIMRFIVLHSIDRSSTQGFNITPFLLHTDTEKAPSFFEVTFILDQVSYRYGFELDRQAVHQEWLFVTKGKTETPLFLRDEEGIGLGADFEEGKQLEDKTRANALFLSVVDQFNGAIANKIIAWFHSWNTISGLNHEAYRHSTFSLLEDEKHKESLLAFYQTLDLGFEQLKIEEEQVAIGATLGVKANGEPSFDSFRMHTIKTFHKKYGPDHKTFTPVEFFLEFEESAGTNKLVDLSGPIFSTLINGGILVVDELDAKLHPLITGAITNLFNASEYNPHNAQLIFATHDTNLLSYGQFRRDQIYFVEKDQYEASDLYSLIEYREGDSDKAVRKDRSFEKDYINGRYGAIPFIGDFKAVLGHG